MVLILVGDHAVYARVLQSNVCRQNLATKHPGEASQKHDGRLQSEAAAGVICAGCT